MGVSFTPSLAALMKAEIKAGEKATTKAMHIAGTSLKAKWRARITGAGLGRKMANTIRSQTYPLSGESLRAAAMVWSKAPKIISAHERGALIKSKNGLYLAIPLPAAGKGPGGRRLTPHTWEKSRGLKLNFVYRRRGPSLLVAESRLNTRGVGVASRSKTGRGVATVPIFLLVKQAKLSKRFDLLADAEAAAASIPGLIVSNWVDERF